MVYDANCEYHITHSFVDLSFAEEMLIQKLESECIKLTGVALLPEQITDAVLMSDGSPKYVIT
jgi:hypothetical protein